MILGHWYLVIPSMQVVASPVDRQAAHRVDGRARGRGRRRRGSRSRSRRWQPGVGPSFRRYILSVDGIFFWQRVLFGLAGPAVLSYLTWETAKIRSTQSATGILYVDFFTVVVGEVLAKYLRARDARAGVVK